MAEQLGAGIPQEVEPLVVALTLGIVTDYTIFFLSACRRARARDAAARGRAALVHRRGADRCHGGPHRGHGDGRLVVGELEFFRAFGPALALTAAISLAVSITFVPASLALFGRLDLLAFAHSPEEGSEDEEPPRPSARGSRRSSSRAPRPRSSRW